MVIAMVYLCIQMIKAATSVVVPGCPCVAQYCIIIKRQKESKEFFDEEGVKVFISTNCWNKYLARNLLPA